MAGKVIDRTPTEWNADEWHLFLCQHCDNRATSPNGMNKVALKIADTMDALRLAAKLADEVEPEELEELISDRSAGRAADAIIKNYVVTRRTLSTTGEPKP